MLRGTSRGSRTGWTGGDDSLRVELRTGNRCGSDEVDERIKDSDAFDYILLVSRDRR